MRYVWRHLPLNDVHPRAQLAAEAAEAAADQGAFWELHDLLLAHQDALNPDDLVAYAEELGLDTERFMDDLSEHRSAARIAEDVDSADLSGVSGTPTFFINGRRHHGSYDISTLSGAVRVAGASGPRHRERGLVELALAPAAAAAVVAGLGIEMRLFAPGRAPSRGEAIIWSVGWLLLAVAVAVGIALTGGPVGEWTTVYLIERSLSLDNVFLSRPAGLFLRPV